jgi:hypothetical protein
MDSSVSGDRAPHSATRSWAGSLFVTAESLRDLDSGLRAVLGSHIDSRLTLELSNSTSLSVSSMDDILKHPNARGRLFEVLFLDCRGVDASCEITISRRATHPPVVMRVRATGEEKMAHVTKEIESRLDAIVRSTGVWRRILSPPRPGEFSLVGYFAIFVPIATALWANRHFHILGMDVASDFTRKLPLELSHREMLTFLVTYLTKLRELDTTRLTAVMFALGAAAVVWTLESRARPTSDVSLDRHFLINDYADHYTRGLLLRDKVLWNGVIGFLLSVLASALIWFFTR